MSQWGKSDLANNAPSYLSEAEKDKVFFVDTTEAQVAGNKAKGLSAGWNLYSTYTDSDSNTRHRAECVVAMSVSSGDAGDAGAIVLNATQMVSGTEYTIISLGTGGGANTDFSTIGSANNDVGATFTANSVGTGTGTVSPTEDDIVADS